MMKEERMAPKRKPLSECGPSAIFYRKNKAARKKKAATDKKVNSRPEQRRKRVELVQERRKRGIYGKGGNDIAHTKNGLRSKSVKANRGSKSDSAGDKRARGGYKNRKKKKK